jgi:hypothetical protein
VAVALLAQDRQRRLGHVHHARGGGTGVGDVERHREDLAAVADAILGAARDLARRDGVRRVLA